MSRAAPGCTMRCALPATRAPRRGPSGWRWPPTQPLARYVWRWRRRRSRCTSTRYRSISTFVHITSQMCLALEALAETPPGASHIAGRQENCASMSQHLQRSRRRCGRWRMPITCHLQPFITFRVTTYRRRPRSRRRCGRWRMRCRPGQRWRPPSASSPCGPSRDAVPWQPLCCDVG